MKEIKAIIRPHRLDAVLEAFHDHPTLPGVTVSNVQGFGKVVHREPDRPDEPVRFGTVAMVKVECIVDDEMLDEAVEVIRKHAHTGSPGDGKIAIYEVAEIVKIRTGERGTKAV